MSKMQRVINLPSSVEPTCACVHVCALTCVICVLFGYLFVCGDGCLMAKLFMDWSG